MPKLILLRHLKSQWNLENRFAGWTDGPLSKEGMAKAKEIAEKIANMKIDAVYTSPLIRNTETVSRIWDYLRDGYPFFIHLDRGKMKDWGHFEETNETNYIPVYISEALNERYYGKLQGLNKEETIKKYGKDLVRQWRRGFDQAPPGGESLKDVVKRVHPFHKKFIENDLKKGNNVLVVASHNSARAIIKLVEKISDRDIINIEMPFGGLLEYEFKGGLYKKLN